MSIPRISLGFCSYLNGWKQYIKITESADTMKKDIRCEVPQGSILGPIRIVHNKMKFEHTKGVFEPAVALNLCIM